MSITVYSVSGAPRAWRVLLGLTFKGLPHDINVLQASKKEHKSAEYLKIHPRGTVPALEYNGLILQDSIAILAWLDRQFPESPLFGETAGDAARIWQATLESCDYLRAATNDVLFSLLVLGKPVPEQWNEERQTLLDNAQTLRQECQRLETLLEGNSFIAGATPSAADAVCFPELCLIQRAIDTKHSDMEALGLSSIPIDFPKLEQWKVRVSKLPNVDKTMPPHWSN